MSELQSNTEIKGITHNESHGLVADVEEKGEEFKDFGNNQLVSGSFGGEQNLRRDSSDVHSKRIEMKNAYEAEASSPTSRNTDDYSRAQKSEGYIGKEIGQENGDDYDDDKKGINSGTPLDAPSNLSFKKKTVTKDRAQSFQSVLSIASSKSLNQLSNNQNMAQYAPTRNGSVVSRNGYANNSKNFQSFIQAPVLSSISNYRKSNEDAEIGKQLPFNNEDKNHKEERTRKEELYEETNDEEDINTILQQQRLTLNALKKLSLSPMPIVDPEQKLMSTTSSKRSKLEGKLKNVEPYKPAEVDLSTFASLTRQPGVDKLEKYEQSQEAKSDVADESNLVSQSQLELRSNVHPIGERKDGKDNSNGVQKDSPSPETFSIPKTDIQSSQERLTPRNSPSKFVSLVSASNSIHKSHRNQEIEDQEEARGPQFSGSVKYDLSNQNSEVDNINAPRATTSFSKHQPSSSVTPDEFPEKLASDVRLSHGARSQHKKQLKQINGFRSPMYVPAVLRMTVNDTPSSLQTSNNTNYRRSESPRNSEVFSNDTAAESRNGTKDVRYDADPNFVASSRNSVSSFDSNYSVDSITSSIPRMMLSIGSLGFRRGDTTRSLPTKRHWVKDETALKCGIPICPKVFNFFERRHHCRKCGGIFCKEHTSHYLYINHQAQFTTGGRGTLSKVCDNCITEYNDFMNHEFGLTQPQHVLKTKEEVESSKKRRSEVTNSNFGFSIQKKSLDKLSNDRAEQTVGSVPANWSWSSF